MSERKDVYVLPMGTVTIDLQGMRWVRVRYPERLQSLFGDKLHTFVICPCEIVKDGILKTGWTVGTSINPELVNKKSPSSILLPCDCLVWDAETGGSIPGFGDKVIPDPVSASDKGVNHYHEMLKDDVYQEAIQNPKPIPLIDELMGYVAKWQKRLRLMDWKVYVRVSRMRDMEGANHAAEVTIKWSEKVVYLRYLNPQDYVGCIADEPELNIIHELCHILTRGICEDQHCDPDAEEIAVICLSEALYKTEYPDWQEKVEIYREVRP